MVKKRMNLCPILKIANLLSQVRSFGGEKRQMLNFGSQVNCRLWFFMKLVISRFDCSVIYIKNVGRFLLIKEVV